jgi:hypothetical protein
MTNFHDLKEIITKDKSVQNDTETNDSLSKLLNHVLNSAQNHVLNSAQKDKQEILHNLDNQNVLVLVNPKMMKQLFMTEPVDLSNHLYSIKLEVFKKKESDDIFVEPKVLTEDTTTEEPLVTLLYNTKRNISNILDTIQLTAFKQYTFTDIEENYRDMLSLLSSNKSSANKSSSNNIRIDPNNNPIATSTIYGKTKKNDFVLLKKIVDNFNKNKYKHNNDDYKYCQYLANKYFKENYYLYEYLKEYTFNIFIICSDTKPSDAILEKLKATLEKVIKNPLGVYYTNEYLESLGNYILGKKISNVKEPVKDDQVNDEQINDEQVKSLTGGRRKTRKHSKRRKKKSRARSKSFKTK